MRTVVQPALEFEEYAYLCALLHRELTVRTGVRPVQALCMLQVYDLEEPELLNLAEKLSRAVPGVMEARCSSR